MSEIKQESKKKDYLFFIFKNVSNGDLQKYVKLQYRKEMQELAYRYLNADNYQTHLSALSYLQYCMQDAKYNTQITVQILYAKALLLCFLGQNTKESKEDVIESLDSSNDEYKEVLFSKISFDQIVAIFTKFVDNKSFDISDNMWLIDLLHQVCKQQKNEQYLLDTLQLLYLGTDIGINIKKRNLLLKTIKKLNDKRKIPDHIKEELYLGLSRQDPSYSHGYWEVTKLYMHKNDTKSKVLAAFYYMNTLVHHNSKHLPDDFVKINAKPLFSGEKHTPCYFVTALSIIAYDVGELWEYGNGNGNMEMAGMIEILLKVELFKNYHGLNKERFLQFEAYVYANLEMDNFSIFDKKIAKEMFTILLGKHLYNTVYVFRVLIEENIISSKSNSLKLFEEILSQQYLQSQLDYLKIGRCIGMYSNIIKSHRSEDYDKVVEIALSIKDIGIDKEFKRFINNLLMQFVMSNNINNFSRAQQLYKKYKAIVNICNNFEEKNFESILDNKAKLYEKSKGLLVGKLCKEISSKFIKLEAKYTKQVVVTDNFTKEEKNKELFNDQLVNKFDDKGLMKEIILLQKRLDEIINKNAWKTELTPIVAAQQEKIWQKEKVFNKKDNKEALCFLTQLDKEQILSENVIN